MPIPRRTIVAAALGVVLYPWLSTAQEDNDSTSKSMRDMTPEERRAAWDAMSEEEKQALREKRRAEWEAMTPDERKAKREEMRERMRNMTPEERAAIRQRRQRAAKRSTKPSDSNPPPRKANPEDR